MVARLVSALSLLGALNCAGSASNGSDDVGADARSYSEHGHSAGVPSHSHGDPSGASDSHAHGLEIDADGVVVWATHQGVFRLDAGSAVPTALHLGDDFLALVADPNESGRYWGSLSTTDPTGSNTGFVTSTDWGASWETVYDDAGTTFDVVAVAESGLIAAAGSGSFWISDDAGVSWESWDWPGECTGIVIADAAARRLLLAGVWGIASVAPGEEPEFVFQGPVTAARRWADGVAYAVAGSLVLCGEDVTATEDCFAIQPPSTHPVRQVERDPSDADTWYLLTAGPELFRKVGDDPWELIATGL